MPTQFIKKMNRTEAGFHLLVMLSLVDGVSNEPELNVIMDFLDNSFPGNIDLIKEQAFLKALPAEDRDNHFREVAAHFLTISDEDDRTLVIDFAMKLVMADMHMDEEENAYVNLLYDLWDMV